MKVLIIGGGGVIGQKLARKLADRGHLRGADIAHMTLADVVNPAPITVWVPCGCGSCRYFRSRIRR